MRLFLRVVIVLSAVLVLSACGGGGGGRSFSLPDMVPDVTPMPDPEPEPEPEPTPTLTTSFQTIDAPSASEVAEYLRIHASGGPWSAGGGYTWSRDPVLVRFAAPPTVRIAQNATEHERMITHYAVSLINRALPYEQHLQFGPDAPTGIAGEWEDGLPGVPDGQVVVEFVGGELHGGRPGSEALGHSDIAYTYDDTQNRWENSSLRAGAVEMKRGAFDGYPEDGVVVSVLIHEMLHSLGLLGHVPEDTFPTSVLFSPWWTRTGGMEAIDLAAVYALHTRLGRRTEPESLSAQSLGTWSDTASVFMGQIGDVTFGVTSHNGLNSPWADGYESEIDLADNPTLQGTVAWNGGLVGVTNDQEPVQGEATLTVDVDSLIGDAAFTELVHSNGDMWGDGDLAYDLLVSGYYLRSTGGDDGVVTGSFYGGAHEGVAGGLERADLTAAFGAVRE